MSEIKTWPGCNAKLVSADDRITELEQQLAEREKQLAEREKQLAHAQMYALGKKLLLTEREKQVAAMRERLLTLVGYAEESNDCQYGTLSTRLVLDIAQEALAATQDLSGLVLCDAEPAAYETYKGYLLHAEDPKVLEHSEPEPLYQRKQP